MKLVLAVLTLSAVAAATSAAAAPPQDAVILRNGNSIMGRVTASTDKSVTLEYPSEAGNATITLAAADLDPYSFYAIRNTAIGEKDAAARVKLAIYCAENGLYSRARMEYERAQAIDPAIKAQVEPQLPGIRARIAADVLERAKKSLANGDLGAAQRDVSDILTLAGDTPAAKEAEDLIGPIEQRIVERDNAERTAAYEKMEKQADEAAKKTAEERFAAVDPIEKDLLEAEKDNMKGLRAARTGTSLDQFKDAASKSEKVLAALKDLEKKDPHPDMLALTAPLKERATRDAVSAHLNAGSLYLTRSSFPDAMKSANSALALDPENSQALSFRARIEIAANENRRRF